MRAATLTMGLMLAAVGIWSFANSGVTFLALAFVIGLAMIIDGAVEGGIYIYARSGIRKDNNVWMLADNIITLLTGILVISGELAADVAVPYVFGMWLLFAGVTRITVSMNIDKAEKKENFMWTAGIGLVYCIAGFAGMFNDLLLGVSLGELIGILIIIKAIGILEIGFHMPHARTIE